MVPTFIVPRSSASIVRADAVTMCHGRTVCGAVKPRNSSLSAVRASEKSTSASPDLTAASAPDQSSFGTGTNSAPVITAASCMYAAERPATSPSMSNSIGGQSGSYATLIFGLLASHAFSDADRSSVGMSIGAPSSGTAIAIDAAAIISGGGLAIMASLSMRAWSTSVIAPIAFSMIAPSVGSASAYATLTSIIWPTSPALYRPSTAAICAL